MSLAGEMGLLVRADDELADGVSLAREEFVRQGSRPQTLPGLNPGGAQGELDLSGVTDGSFLAEVEDRLLASLHTFAAGAAGADRARRRLFADDSIEGVALLEVLRTRFDVVLMNPPFGAGSLKAKRVFDKSYPRTKNDLYAAFVERGIELLAPHGLLGAITSRTGFFLSSFQRWREEVLLGQASPLVFADLGHGVLDGAMVEVAAYCLERA